jgi:hypothetical protein
VGLAVQVWSKVLGEAVVLASDHAKVDPGELRSVYRARVTILAGLTEPAVLGMIHAIKKTFRGTITDAASGTSGRRVPDPLGPSAALSAQRFHATRHVKGAPRHCPHRCRRRSSVCAGRGRLSHSRQGAHGENFIRSHRLDG